MLLERNFASLRQSFPTFMASCDCFEFLQAVHDVSCAWAQHLRESRLRSSLADHHIASSNTSAMWLLDGVRPVCLPPPPIPPAQAAEPSDHPEGLAGAEPADSALFGPFHASLSASVCPWPRPTLQVAASNAGEVVDAELSLAWPDSGCSSDTVRLCDDSDVTAAWAIDMGVGAATDEGAWTGDWACGADGGSQWWTRSASDSEESARDSAAPIFADLLAFCPL